MSDPPYPSDTDIGDVDVASIDIASTDIASIDVAGTENGDGAGKIQEDGEQIRLFVLGWPERLWFAWVTVVIPALAFGLSSLELHLVDWKEPSAHIWPALFLDRPGTLPFLPLAMAVILVCVAIVTNPGSWARFLPVRWLLALGSVLAIQYGAMNLAYLVFEWRDGGLVSLLVVIALFVGIAELSVLLVRCLRWWIARTLRNHGPRALTIAWYLGALVIWVAAIYASRYYNPDRSLFASVVEAPLIPLGFFFVASLLLGPIWSCLALFRLQRQLGPLDPPSPSHFAVGLAMLAAYLYSWRVALVEVIRAWEALPDRPPNCFVATAAARGPARLVGGERVPMAGGSSWQTTAQLQRFKLFELLLVVVVPGLHRRLRRFYDRWGPKAAARIRGPVTATLAWLLLKPAEAAAVLCVRLVLGHEAREWRRRLYR